MGGWMDVQPGLHCLLCAATQAWCALHMACVLLLIADPSCCCLGFCRLCVQTGMWCQLRPLPSNTSQIGMICDQPTAATATVMTYTGSGLAYNGIDLVASGPGLPLLLENTTALASAYTGPTADDLTLVPALTGAVYRIAVTLVVMPLKMPSCVTRHSHLVWSCSWPSTTFTAASTSTEAAPKPAAGPTRHATTTSRRGPAAAR